MPLQGRRTSGLENPALRGCPEVQVAEQEGRYALRAGRPFVESRPTKLDLPVGHAACIPAGMVQISPLLTGGRMQDCRDRRRAVHFYPHLTVAQILQDDRDLYEGIARIGFPGHDERQLDPVRHAGNEVFPCQRHGWGLGRYRRDRSKQQEECPACHSVTPDCEGCWFSAATCVRFTASRSLSWQPAGSSSRRRRATRRARRSPARSDRSRPEPRRRGCRWGRRSGTCGRGDGKRFEGGR